MIMKWSTLQFRLHIKTVKTDQYECNCSLQDNIKSRQLCRTVPEKSDLESETCEHTNIIYEHTAIICESTDITGDDTDICTHTHTYRHISIITGHRYLYSGTK